MGGRREIWFRNLASWAPWSVYPVHWKGLALIILGPLALAGIGNVLIWSHVPALITVSLFFAGGTVFLVAVYKHTSWD